MAARVGPSGPRAGGRRRVVGFLLLPSALWYALFLLAPLAVLVIVSLGERAASAHLQKLGLKFLTANFKSARGEIDLIFRDDDCLVFVEVKARSSEDWVRPAAAVNAVRTKGRVEAGEKVFVQGGASGSGSMAIQVAKALGAHVITTVSTEAKAAKVRLSAWSRLSGLSSSRSTITPILHFPSVARAEPDSPNVKYIPLRINEATPPTPWPS